MKLSKLPLVLFLTIGALVATTTLLTLLSSTPATAAPVAGTASFPVIADFENGAPPDWFVYNGGGSSVSPSFVVSNTGILSVSFNVTDFGGFGALLGAGQDWSNYQAVRFDFYGTNSGLTYVFEAQDGTGAVVERFHGAFVDDFTGWRQVVIPFSTFSRGGFQDGGAPNDGFQLDKVKAWVFPLPIGNSSLKLDNLTLTNLISFADYEGGAPTDWFVYNGGSSTVTPAFDTISDTHPYALPGQMGANAILSGTFNIGDFGGFGALLKPGQDWSSYEGVYFWFYGHNSGATFTFEAQDGTSGNGVVERFHATFTDSFSGWRPIALPFDTFVRGGFQDGGAPNDGFNRVDIRAWAFPLPAGAGQVVMDQMSVYGDAGTMALAVQLDADSYKVTEGSQVTPTVSLNMTSTYTVTVNYATLPGTATSADFTGISGTLSFHPGEQTKSLPIMTVDDDVIEGDETFTLHLSDPVSVSLGVRMTTSVTILDNENPIGGKSQIVDDYELNELVAGMVGTAEVGWVTWSAPTASSSITLTQIVSGGTPAPVPGLGLPNTVLQLDTDVNTGEWAGFTHAFTNDKADSWTPQDWSSYKGVAFWLYGNNTGGNLFFDLLDNRNPGATSDDAERWSIDIPDNFSGWKFFTIPFSDLKRKDIGNGAPNDGLTLTQVHGYAFGAFGTVDMGARTNYVDQFSLYGATSAGSEALKVAFAPTKYLADEGTTATVTVTLNMTSSESVTVHYRSAESYASADRDYTAVSGTLTIPAGSLTSTFTVSTTEDAKHEGDEQLMLVLSNPTNAVLGFGRQALLTIVDDDPQDPALVHDFEGFHSFSSVDHVTLSVQEMMTGSNMARPGQGNYEKVLSGTYNGGRSHPAQMSEMFVEPWNWSTYKGISFWYYGSNSGEQVMVELYDNQITSTADLSATNWSLVWSDEFSGTTGTPPNPNVWRHELGDGTMNGIPGWGNSESQYYTGHTDNAALDGMGNLAITLRKVATETSDLACWYGPCEYTSARLITRERMEFAYGRMEARIQVPSGGNGLWPAFWMLGTDIGDVGWPQSGEIDIMEYVSRIPNEIFGTIHGPGYSGGNAFGNTHDFGVPAAQTAHVYAVEWGPDEIRWYVDGINYHNARPADVAPNQWVFNHPFFFILNMAIGGNFGGAIDPALTFPQTMKVDYVRVYQGVNQSERYKAGFVDNFEGWRKITLPFSTFTRSSQQPAGAPNDGLTLSAIWGYSFMFPADKSGSFHLDRVYLETEIPASEHIIYMPTISQAASSHSRR